MCDALVNITIACMIDLRYLKHPFSGLFAFNLDLINGSVLLVNEIASWILHLFFNSSEIIGLQSVPPRFLFIVDTHPGFIQQNKQRAFSNTNCPNELIKLRFGN